MKENTLILFSRSQGLHLHSKSQRIALVGNPEASKLQPILVGD